MSMLTSRGAGRPRPPRLRLRRPRRSARSRSSHRPRFSGSLQARRARRRRQGAVLAAILLAIGGGVGSWWFLWRESAAAPATLTCPPPAPPQLVAPAPAPVPPARVTLNVYNATDRQGLAAQVADDLEKRGFKIKKVGNAPAKADVPGPAEVRSGPKGDAARVALAAHVDAETLVSDARKDATVDLVIGRSFQQLLTPQDAAAALTPSPVAAPGPAGC